MKNYISVTFFALLACFRVPMTSAGDPMLRGSQDDESTVPAPMALRFGPSPAPRALPIPNSRRLQPGCKGPNKNKKPTCTTIVVDGDEVIFDEDGNPVQVNYKQSSEDSIDINDGVGNGNDSIDLALDDSHSAGQQQQVRPLKPPNDNYNYMRRPKPRNNPNNEYPPNRVPITAVGPGKPEPKHKRGKLDPRLIWEPSNAKIRQKQHRKKEEKNLLSKDEFKELSKLRKELNKPPKKMAGRTAAQVKADRKEREKKLNRLNELRAKNDRYKPFPQKLFFPGPYAGRFEFGDESANSNKKNIQRNYGGQPQNNNNVQSVKLDRQRARFNTQLANNFPSMVENTMTPEVKNQIRLQAKKQLDDMTAELLNYKLPPKIPNPQKLGYGMGLTNRGSIDSFSQDDSGIDTNDQP